MLPLFWGAKEQGELRCPKTATTALLKSLIEANTSVQ
jgi:hypothetical protein